MIRQEAWPFYRTSSGVRLGWELEEPKGPKGPKGYREDEGHLAAHVGGDEMVDPEGQHCPVLKTLKAGMIAESYLDLNRRPRQAGGAVA